MGRTVEVVRAVKYRTYFDDPQELLVNAQGDTSRALWNLIHEVYTFYAGSHVYNRRFPTMSELDGIIKDGRKDVPWLADLPAQASQAVLRTYFQAWKNCWNPDHPAKAPKYKSRKARRAVDIPQGRDLALVRTNKKWGTAKVPKVGHVKIRMHAAPPDIITGARLVREGSHWFLVVRGRYLRKPPPAPPAIERVGGGDVGVAHTITTSDGIFFDAPPTLTPGEQQRLLRLERKAARQRAHHKRGTPISHRLRRTYAQIADLKARAARRRYDFNHKTARALADTYTLFVVERLNIKNMTASACGTLDNPGTNVAAKSGLNRSILDQAWGQLFTFLEYKLQDLGGTLLRVPPQHTSTTCHRCGSNTPGQRESQASFQCADPSCGWAGNADINAAINILIRGMEEASQCVERKVTSAKKRKPQSRTAA